jgi:dienelactone hydrolase
MQSPDATSQHPASPQRAASKRIVMRAIGALFMAVLGAGIGAPPTWGQDTAAKEAAERIAVEVANDLANKNFPDVVARFTPDVARGLPLAALDKLWNGILDQGGAVRTVEAARTVRTTPDGILVVVVPIKLEKITLDVTVALAKDKIAGLHFAPSQPTYAPWSPPAYVDQSTFTNVEVTIGSPPTALGGTLTLPKSDRKVAAVVLVHGSGPNDRDETLGPNRIFRDIAEGLASRGVAVLRYDKRTKVHPEQFAGDSTVREETIDDVQAAVTLLRQRAEIDPDKVLILGHSLGGTLAPRIADGGHGIAAVVLLAAAARPLPAITVEQVEYLASLDGPPDQAAQQQIEQIKAEAARALAAKPGDAGPPIMGVPPAYWADLNAYDAAATAAKLSIPLLALQGGRDYQVTSADLQRFKVALAGHPNVTIREFHQLNHLFIAGDGKSRPEEYTKPGHVDPAVIDTVAAFIAGLQK